jgi:hypothetical protein
VLEDTITEVIANIMIAWDGFIELLKSPLKLDAWKNFTKGILGLFSTTLEEVGKAVLAQFKIIASPIFKTLELLNIIDKDEQGVEKKLYKTSGGGKVTLEEGKKKRLQNALREAGSRSILMGGAGAAALNNTQLIQSTKSESNNTIKTQQKIDVTIKGDATGIDKRQLESVLKEAVSESNAQALRDIETGIVK